MTQSRFKQLPAYKSLAREKRNFEKTGFTLKSLINDENRFNDCSVGIDNFFYDFSKQFFDSEIFTRLMDLSRESGAKEKFSDMISGKIVNTTENRAALHTAARMPSSEKNRLDNPDVLQLIDEVKGRIHDFCDDVHNGVLLGSTGQKFTDAVVVGIGGSYLGCEFVYTALKGFYPAKIRLHFLSNVDIDNFGSIISSIDPEKTLWIVISKSYTTTETMANLNQVMAYLERHSLAPDTHIVTVTAKGSPGDNATRAALNTFHMFDFIGGRYSVTSAVGGVPLSLAFGCDVFENFLGGCHRMDLHAASAENEKNIPLISALLNIWNSNFLHYPAQAIIPYSSALSRLAPHVQQLYMESMGKNVTTLGEPVDYQTGVIIFGEPGTNAQHSFFQLAHQGRAFPIEFIGVVKPAFTGVQVLSKGVSNHQELWANMIAQATALAVGKDNEDTARYFSGDRPSSTVVINDLCAESIGMLLSYYEARTVFEAFILGINPFDQFGVELGKHLASGIRDHIAKKNDAAGYYSKSLDPASRFYIDVLFKGHL